MRWVRFKTNRLLGIHKDSNGRIVIGFWLWVLDTKKKNKESV